MLKKKSFLPYFSSIKDKTKEFGYFGCDELNYYAPLYKHNSLAFASAYHDDKNILGVKSLYYVSIPVKDEIKLPNLSNYYDVLENIRISDMEGNEITNFSIIICNEKDGNCQMTNEKTILISSSNTYKIHANLHESIANINVSAIGYYFGPESRRQLLNFI